MDQTTIDHLLAISTLIDASAGVDAIAEELIGLHDAWRATDASTQALAWLGGLIAQLGWWSGRMEAAANPDGISPSVPDSGLR